MSWAKHALALALARANPLLERGCYERVEGVDYKVALLTFLFSGRYEISIAEPDHVMTTDADRLPRQLLTERNIISKGFCARIDANTCTCWIVTFDMPI